MNTVLLLTRTVTGRLSNPGCSGGFGPNTCKRWQKPFLIMQPKDWDKAPRNTNGVQRALNCLAKSGSSRPPLYATLQLLYKKNNKMFAQQYIAAAENDSNISYRTPQEEHWAQCSSRRIKRKQGVPDTSAKFGPPDKSEHFASPLDSDDDFDLPPLSKKVRG